MKKKIKISNMKTFKQISESNYAKHKGKTHSQLYKMLKNIYDKYDEYHDEGFKKMIDMFAEDDFYNMHFVAKTYKETEDWIKR